MKRQISRILREFSDREKERYRGHLSLCEVDLAGQSRLHASRVAIVGCGGLGSPVALYLAAAGIGSLVLIDDDTVSLSNLQRQIAHYTSDLGRQKVISAADKIKNLNPGVEVICHQCRLDKANCRDLLAGCDTVADCTDSFTSRITVGEICREMDIPAAVATVSGFSGQAFTFLPGHAWFADYFGTEQPDCDGKACSISGVLNTAVGVMGSIQATEILKILVKTGTPLTDTLLTFDALTMTFQKFNL